MAKQQPLKLRPSSASRWIACPASAKLSTLVPYQEAGEAAKIGTAIHALAETCFQLDSDPMKFVGQCLASHHGNGAIQSYVNANDAPRCECGHLTASSMALLRSCIFVFRYSIRA